MQRGITILILSIHIRTVCDKQFDDFLVTVSRRRKQRGLTILILSIHIRTLVD